MKFIVSKIGLCDKEKPILGAKLEDYEYINLVTGALEEGWVIEINSLEELIELEKKY